MEEADWDRADGLNRRVKLADLFEEVYSKTAVVYHRTHKAKNVETIRQEGFRAGPRGTYGTGIYATYDLHSQMQPYMVKQYGLFIIKSRLNLDGFLIFDPDVAARVYGPDHTSIEAQCRLKGFEISDRKWSPTFQEIIDRPYPFTSDRAKVIVTQELVTGMKGMVYTGRQDGRCVVVYDPEAILPIAYVEQTFELPKTDEEYDAVRSQLQWKRIINPDLVSQRLRSKTPVDNITDKRLSKVIDRRTQMSPANQLALVTRKSSMIGRIIAPTVEAQWAAITDNPDNIAVIDKPDLDVAAHAIRMSWGDKIDAWIAGLPDETRLAILRRDCLTLPKIARVNPEKMPTREQQHAAWQAPNAEEIIYMADRLDQKLDASTAPVPELCRVLERVPGDLSLCRNVPPEAVAAAVMSPKAAGPYGNGNNALGNCYTRHVRVDTSMVPDEFLIKLVTDNPYLIYTLEKPTIPVIAAAMRNDPSVARAVGNMPDLPDELRALVPPERSRPVFDRLGESEEYRGEHQAPDAQGGAPLHDLTKNGIYPDDVYGPDGFRYYANTGEAADAESFDIAMRMRGHPNRVVRIFRAIPKDVKGRPINPGDWVAVSRRYAVEHGKSALNGSYRIISKVVSARDVFTDGNSISEWGYDPQPYDAESDRRKREARLARSNPPA